MAKALRASLALLRLGHYNLTECMGFFDKVKSSLNIGGSKLTIQTPASVQNGTALNLKVTVQGGKLEQVIKEVKVELIEEESWTENKLGGQATPRSKKTTIATAGGGNGFTIQPGEAKEFDFALNVSASPDAGSMGGVMGTLGKLNNMATRRRRQWSIKGRADIEGSADATDNANITITY